MGEILYTITTSFSMDTSPHPITLSFLISQPVSKVSPLYQDLDLLRSLPSSLFAWMPASQYDGDYGVGWFGEDIKDPDEKARKLNVELNNGRAAMLGIIGNMVAEELTGQTMYEQYAAGHISPFGDGQGVF